MRREGNLKLLLSWSCDKEAKPRARDLDPTRAYRGELCRFLQSTPASAENIAEAGGATKLYGFAPAGGAAAGTFGAAAGTFGAAAGAFGAAAGAFGAAAAGALAGAAAGLGNGTGWSDRVSR
jgi:hypothetical protein